ncbi:MAG: endopeptidase La [Bradyrhizobium sp.]
MADANVSDHSGTAADQRHPVVPEDATIILPVRNMLLFPGVVLPLTIGRPSSIAAAQEAVRSGRKVGLLLQDDPNIEQPGPEHLRRVGTMAEILRYVTSEDTHYVIARGLRRFRVKEFLPDFPFLVARVEEIGVSEVMTPEVEARMQLLKTRAREAIRLLPNLPPEIAAAVDSLESPSALADFLAGIIDTPVDEKQDLIETFDVTQLLDKLLGLLATRIQVLQLSKQIGEQTQHTLSSQQREHILREQLRQIQKELGEDDAKSAELKELAEKIEKAGMPDEAEDQARKELKRLDRMPEAAAEYAMIRTYLDWLIELPWSRLDPERIDIAEARRILEEDHYGLENVKRRILEYLAVRKLNPDGKAPILCFVGPPGVGKTSLGQSIARAIGRKFVRLSLGGVHDESEIRGHRRTYIGALPGNVIQSIHKAGTRNPVMMLDELDKLGAGFHGDPSAALLEVLDPEQNATFRDNYLAVPFDLSKVLFIGTANVADNIPPAVRDRMEVIEIPGYIADEKLGIAKRYLVKRQLASAGLTEEQCRISDEILLSIIRDYTREAGVRNLERQIGALCRHAAMRIAEGSATSVAFTMGDLQVILGPKRFEQEIAMRTSVPGIATGLAWTPAGGDILFVEATSIPGRGKLILTGQLGDVMKESAQAALTLVKSRAAEFGVDTIELQKSDVHVHVPAGAIPKDGPSAGVAMFMALTSLLTGRTVRSDTAMTGEISLRGLVLPIGGVKEKVLAAIQAGIATVMLPARNRKDLEDVPEKARNQVRFVWLERVDDAIEAALNPPQTHEPGAPRTSHTAPAEKQVARSR